MRFQTKVAVALSVLLFPSRAVFAADDLKSVLLQLNAAAARFHSVAADLVAENAQTDPIPNTDVQTGAVYCERKGRDFDVALHLEKENGRAVPKVMVFKGGVGSMFEKLTNQVTTSKGAGKYESYFALGFGASGNDLEAKWTIKYAGSEEMKGVKVARLELIAKDPDVAKMLPKVTIWIDTERDVSLKQYFDEGQGQSRTATYSNIKLNQPLPGDAFSFKTDSKTQYVNR